MNKKSQSQQPLGLVLTALADPVRRAIFQRLLAGPDRVTALAAPFDISLNSVSKHIRVLEQAGLVTRRRKGREHLLSVATNGLDPLSDWLKETEQAWQGRLECLDHTLTLNQGERK